MEHLVQGHLGGYWVDNRDVEDITTYCEQCGDSDWILLSWEEGHMIEALTNYFSSLKTAKEMIERYRESGITKTEVIQDILYDYEDDKYIIVNLLEDNTITEEETKKLIKANLQARKNQIEMVCEVYPKKQGKVLEKKNNNQ